MVLNGLIAGCIDFTVIHQIFYSFYRKFISFTRLLVNLVYLFYCNDYYNYTFYRIVYQFYCNYYDPNR